MTVPAQTVTGIHYVDVIATISDADTPVVRLAIPVVYPTTTARSGMSDIITELRLRASAEANEYSIAGAQYWTDAQLQTILDNNRTDYIYDEMVSVP